VSVEVIHAEALSFRYNSALVLEDVTFSVPAGEFLGIVGPNGSGKTTLIKLALGLVPASGGKVSLFGAEPPNFREWRRVGYVPQKATNVNPNFPATVREIVGLGLLSSKPFPKRMSRADDGAVARALDSMGIGSIADKLIGELSGGQQQRTLIARALVNNPELLILDEPTTALDPDGREGFFALLTELNREKGITVLMVTHDLGTIGQYASSLLYVDKRLIFSGSFEQFCGSADMGQYFGPFSQHLICHRHDHEEGSSK
jgi:zinc transport system ATP-binding protein